MKRRQTGIAVSLVFAAAALISAAVGCKDSNTISGNDRLVSTPKPNAPTPTPASGIAGWWGGTWTPSNLAHFGGCRSSVEATAYFTLEGVNVTGTIYTAKQPDRALCSLGNVIFHGSLEGSSLHGTITASHFTGTAHGSLSGTTLDIQCVLTGDDITPAPYSGSVHLHR